MDALTSTTIHAACKWFDAVRGYGFVNAPGIPGDILLPGPRLEAAGRGSLADGTGLTVEIRTTPRGIQVERIISIDAAPPVGAPVAARVKWFNARERYGFVQLLGEPGDVFLGRDVLRSSGRDGVVPGEALAVIVGRGDRGPVVEAVGEWV